MKMKIGLSILFAVLLAAIPAAAQSGLATPRGLRTEYLVNPLGIDVTHPRFSWRLSASARDEAQSAYEILVAENTDDLARMHGASWDSGKVASSDSFQAVYAGAALESGHTYYWEVRVWDSQGRPTAYSEPASFEMGLLSRDEWKGQWIGGGGELRKSFRLPGKVRRARVYVTALGYYELHLNGAKVGHRVLDPAFTTYTKRVLYATYDVTNDLHSGDNAIGAMLGGGWATLSGPFKPYYSQPELLLQMNVELADGKTFTLASDNTWKTAPGPVVSDSVYNGEIFDARRETPGWDSAGFDDSSWAAARVFPGTQGALSAEMMPPIRVVDEMVPRSVANPAPGVYVFDMGQNMTGWARLRVNGPRGARIELRYAELIYPNGMINRANLRTAKSRDIFILKGGPETLHAQFTYHGFRYVEVTGFPGTPGLGSLRGEVVHTAVRSVGEFAASKQILNQIQHLIYWSQLTNLMSIPTDCDQRDERQGWMGDAQVTAEEAMMNFDMAAFYTNFVRDIRDVQGPDGSITDTVPHKYGSRPADPAWGTAYPMICWHMWRQYGDRRILEENYDGLKKYVGFLQGIASGNVLTMSHYGDWVPIVHTDSAFVSDAYYYADVNILSEIAGVLGKTADQQTYAALAGSIKDALNQKFYDASKGVYANGTQTANAMAIELGLVPQQHDRQVASNLTNDITYYHNTHITTGFIGIKFLMPALVKIGRADLAYELASQTTYPSWGYMVKQGATTLWELWQDKSGPSMNSQDHIMFGSVGAWFYRALAGINLAEDGAGYRHIIIRPNIVEDLASASGTIGTMRGEVSSSWNHLPGKIELNVVIPPGADARVLVPQEEEMTDVTVRDGNRVIWDHDHYVAGDPGVSSASHSRRGVEFEIGSGRYSFTLTGE